MKELFQSIYSHDVVIDNRIFEGVSTNEKPLYFWGATTFEWWISIIFHRTLRTISLLHLVHVAYYTLALYRDQSISTIACNWNPLEE